MSQGSLSPQEGFNEVRYSVRFFVNLDIGYNGRLKYIDVVSANELHESFLTSYVYVFPVSLDNLGKRWHLLRHSRYKVLKINDFNKHTS